MSRGARGATGQGGRPARPGTSALTPGPPPDCHGPRGVGEAPAGRGVGARGVEPWVRVAVLSAGGVLGVNARSWLGVGRARCVDSRSPWPTFAVNVSGALPAGFLSAALGAALARGMAGTAGGG